MGLIRFFCIVILLSLSTACSKAKPTEAVVAEPSPVSTTASADTFGYPIGKNPTVTQAKDSDEWYNALDLGENDHLGEDWNKNTGGNTDCGEPVFSIANGEITYAADGGPGWGNVIIVTHTLPDGTRVQSLYGHLQEISKREGEVKKREQIGLIGNANGRYLCHLHLELRQENSRDWNRPGGGYSSDRKGWLDPSDFIDQRRRHER